MSIKKAANWTYCDHCKMEFGSYNSVTAHWTFRTGSGYASWTIQSEMSKSNGAIRHYCRWHLTRLQQWPPANPEQIWPLDEQLAYAKQMEMAAANV